MKIFVIHSVTILRLFWFGDILLKKSTYVGYILLLIRAVTCLWLFELGYVLLNLLISGNILLFYVQLHGVTNLCLFETGDALVILRHVLSGATQFFSVVNKLLFHCGTILLDSVYLTYVCHSLSQNKQF